MTGTRRNRKASEGKVEVKDRVGVRRGREELPCLGGSRSAVELVTISWIMSGAEVVLRVCWTSLALVLLVESLVVSKGPGLFACSFFEFFLVLGGVKGGWSDVALGVGSSSTSISVCLLVFYC
ncbi:hypothetical protein NPIL_344941 [Nephila pilipes]|uniref:Uncharacterized protein n=1 Tax=Nephila pilipes TaxID=299642 RepID=A0A8X6NJF8_NEPPI|nr:hypothetical protein NPIL_344941 [Nephila pilipes]